MEIEVFTSAAVQGVPLLLVVMGLTYFWGMLGASGKTQLIASFLTGFSIGMIYMVIQVEPPAGVGWYPVFVYWASNALYAAGMGLVPSGVYEAIKKASQKGNVQAIEVLESQAMRGADVPRLE